MKRRYSNTTLPVLLLSGLVAAGCSSSSSTPTLEPDGDDPNALPNGALPDEGITEGSTPNTDTEQPIVTPGGGNNSGASGSASFLGTLDLSHESIGNITDISGLFFNLDGQFPIAQLEQGFGEQVSATDTCEQSSLGTQLGTDIGEVDVDAALSQLSQIPSSVSAGEVITFSSPAGTYASLMASTAFGFSIYSTQDDVGVSGQIPQGLTVDIPGAAGGFPAFANAAVPSASPLNISVTANGDGGLTLSWNPDTGGNRAVTATLTAFDQSAADFSSTRYIDCTLQDDGTQTIPANLLPTGNVLVNGIAARTSIAFVQQGDAVLVITATSDGFIPPTTL